MPHPHGGQVLNSVPTDADGCGLVRSTTCCPAHRRSSYATLFTFSYATAPFYLFSRPATARVYVDCDDVVPVMDAVQVSVKEQSAAVVTLAGAGFDQYSVYITRGAIQRPAVPDQRHCSSRVNQTLVLDSQRRVIYQPAQPATR